ncbi:MAG: hypothetical protein NVSMB14_06250 [Isosphaeraceae bacterium]
MNNGLQTRVLALVTHDLRNPLHTIGLTLNLMEQLADDRADLEEELRVIRLNLFQMERMLKHLADHVQLIQQESRSRLKREAFDPRRLVDAVVEEQLSRRPPPASPASKNPSARWESLANCPERVDLDQTLARLALSLALSNTLDAAGDKPARAVLDGKDDRLLIRFETDVPPPSTLSSSSLDPDRFDRLLGVPGERVGLELAIVARVSTIFGGSARLDVNPGSGTAIVLDWPISLAEKDH